MVTHFHRLDHSLFSGKTSQSGGIPWLASTTMRWDLQVYQHIARAGLEDPLKSIESPGASTCRETLRPAGVTK